VRVRVRVSVRTLKISKPVLLLPRRCLDAAGGGLWVSVLEMLAGLWMPYLEGDSSGTGLREGRRTGFSSGVGGVFISTVVPRAEERSWEVRCVGIVPSRNSVESDCVCVYDDETDDDWTDVDGEEVFSPFACPLTIVAADLFLGFNEENIVSASVRFDFGPFAFEFGGRRRLKRRFGDCAFCSFSPGTLDDLVPISGLKRDFSGGGGGSPGRGRSW